MKETVKKLSALDLFCGAGGLALGFEEAGFETVAGIDSDKQSLDTFSLNFPKARAIKADISNLESEIVDYLSLLSGKIDVIVGGPPCQGFSIAGKRLLEDPRNALYRHYVQIVKLIRPAYVVIENVPTIRTMGGGVVARSIQDDLSDLGYRVIVQTVNASDFGVPQNRRRTFFIAKLGAEPLGFPEATHINRKVNTKDAIGDLPVIEDHYSEGPIPYSREPFSDFQIEMREGSSQIWNHWSVRHTEKTKQTVSLVPDGGNFKDLPDELQDTRRVNIAWTRMNSASPSFTIDAGHNHHFHYEANRVPTVRESARIQSFPDKFVFLGNKTSQFRQVGNAVPPLLARQLARNILEDLLCE